MAEKLFTSGLVSALLDLGLEAWHYHHEADDAVHILLRANDHRVRGLFYKALAALDHCLKTLKYREVLGSPSNRFSSRLFFGHWQISTRSQKHVDRTFTFESEILVEVQAEPAQT